MNVTKDRGNYIEIQQRVLKVNFVLLHYRLWEVGL
jgi:hypothetical protein